MTVAAIALLGTSADPPTRGHQVLLEGLLNRYGQVATWASDNPLKQHDAPLELRAMLLGQLVEQLQDERLELAQHLSSPYTLITLQRAAKNWPNRELVFVVVLPRKTQGSPRRPLLIVLFWYLSGGPPRVTTYLIGKTLLILHVVTAWSTMVWPHTCHDILDLEFLLVVSRRSRSFPGRSRSFPANRSRGFPKHPRGFHDILD